MWLYKLRPQLFSFLKLPPHSNKNEQLILVQIKIRDKFGCITAAWTKIKTWWGKPHHRSISNKLGNRPELEIITATQKKRTTPLHQRKQEPVSGPRGGRTARSDVQTEALNSRGKKNNYVTPRSHPPHHRLRTGGSAGRGGRERRHVAGGVSGLTTIRANRRSGSLHPRSRLPGQPGRP